MQYHNIQTKNYLLLLIMLRNVNIHIYVKQVNPQCYGKSNCLDNTSNRKGIKARVIIINNFLWQQIFLH